LKEKDLHMTTPLATLAASVSKFSVNQRDVEIIVSKIVATFLPCVGGDKKLARNMARGAKLIAAGSRGVGAQYLPTKAGLAMVGGFTEEQCLVILAHSPVKLATAEKVEKLVSSYAKVCERKAKLERIAKRMGLDLAGAIVSREKQQQAALASSMGVRLGNA
jgi:hypothetical protein